MILCLRPCLSKKKYIFLVENSKINHKGNSSVNEKYKDEIEINRNWHVSYHVVDILFLQKTFWKYKSFCKNIAKIYLAKEIKEHFLNL